MHTPHWTHLAGSRIEIPFFMIMAFSLQYSTQVPQPVQSPSDLNGWIRPIIPISFSIGLVQAFGHPDMAIRIFTGISLPNNF